MALDLNIQNNDGETALQCALRKSNFPFDLLNKFLKLGANVKIRNFNGRTPLHDAARHSPLGIQILDALLEKGGELNAIDNEGNSVLHDVLKNPFVTLETVRMLLEKGAYPDFRDMNYYPPLGYCEIVSVEELLIQYTVIDKFRRFFSARPPFVPADKILNLSFCNDTDNHKKRINYRDACIAEIMEMGKDLIARDYTLYDFVVQHYCRKFKGENVKEKSVLDEVFVRIKSNKYPHCKDILHAAIKHSDLNLSTKLLEVDICAYVSIEGSEDKAIILNAECASEICKLLSRHDAINVIIAFPSKKQSDMCASAKRKFEGKSDLSSEKKRKF